MAAEHPRLRRDLTWRRFVMEGHDSFVFKDELSMEYTKLDAISGTLALRLDGNTSPEDLLEFAQQQWPGLEFDADYIADVLADLRRLRFIDDPFQRNAMVEARIREDRAQINASTLKNLFSIPLGTVDPDRFLDRTYRYVAFLFQPFFVWLGIALFTASGYLIYLNRDHAAMGAGHLLLGPGRELLGVLLMWVTITLAIVVHELGHGYAVKHHGGKVHRLGFIFVFGLPCMFCDTSDSHLFPERKRRAFVALAGTYTELYVASIAAVIWWLTRPELVVNQLAYNLVLFASVSSILFNYNPLIKMDGYYLLSDLLDMPNLQEDAFRFLVDELRHRFLGIEPQVRVVGRRRKRILAAFGLLSIAYSAFFGVLVFGMVRSHLIRIFGWVGALTSVALLVFVLRRLLQPATNAAQIWILDHRGMIRRQLLWIVLAGCLIAGIVLGVPFPGGQAFEATLEPVREAALVSPGELRVEEIAFHAGDRVAAGALLARLDPDTLALDRDDAWSRSLDLRVRAAAARARGADAEVVASLRHAAAEERRSDVIERRVQGTEARAPFAGTVLTASDPTLPNRDLGPGDTLCTIGDFSAVRARLRVPELELEEVRFGAPVRLRLRSGPGQVLRGRVTAIEPDPELVGNERSFRVWALLENAPSQPRQGLTGRAWVRTPSHSLAMHVWQWVARFVRSDLWV